MTKYIKGYEGFVLNKIHKFVKMITEYDSYPYYSEKKNKEDNYMGKNLKGKSIGRGICQRKDGIYQAKIYMKGTPKPIYLYDANLNNLRLKRKRFDMLNIQGYSSKQIMMYLDDWFDYWMETVCAKKLKNTSIRNYYVNYNRIKGKIGHIRLVNLNQMSIQTACNELSNQYKKASIQSTLRVLKSCLEYAVTNCVIVRNPCQGVVVNEQKCFIPREKQEDSKYLDRDLLEQFFETAKNSRSYSYFYILLHTGLRVGELCALQWKDIDFEKQELHVYKTINRTDCYFDEQGNKLDKPVVSVQITTPKREASNRIVPLTKEVIDAFYTIREYQMQDKKNNKNWGSDNPFLKKYPDLFLTTKKGNCFIPNYIDRECKRLTDKLNKKQKKLAEKENRDYTPVRIHPHMFRHTFVTNCYQRKIDSKIILDIVGHRNLEMTNHYTHPENEFMHQEFEKYKRSNTKENEYLVS